jgi:hypothetical protein
LTTAIRSLFVQARESVYLDTAAGGLSIIGGCYRLPASRRITEEFINLTHTARLGWFGVMPLQDTPELRGSESRRYFMTQ